MTKRRSAQRGALLVAALLLFSLLLALGLGMMSAQSARMRVAEAQVKSVQAKALCEAAWEDVRVKLGKDILLPKAVDGQTFLAYSEDVSTTIDGVEQALGSYTVVIDFHLNKTQRESPDLAAEADVTVPEGIYQITCIGKVGTRAAQPLAERVMVYELCMADRDDPDQSFRVIRVQDQGSL